MKIDLPEDLAASIRAEMQSGHFDSEDDVVVAAVREYLQRKNEKAGRSNDADACAHNDQSENEPHDLELQLRLLKAGVISEIKPPVTDLTPYRNRKAVEIEGEPLSETIIRERR